LGRIVDVQEWAVECWFDVGFQDAALGCRRDGRVTRIVSAAVDGCRIGNIENIDLTVVGERVTRAAAEAAVMTEDEELV